MQSRLIPFTCFAFVLFAFAGIDVADADAQLPDISLEQKLGQQEVLLDPEDAKPKVTITLAPTQKWPAETAILVVRIDLPADGYTYSTNPDFVGATKIMLAELKGLKAIDDDFQPDHPPKLVDDPLFGKTVEKFTESVTWTRRFQIEPDATPDGVSIAGTLRYQVCDANRCVSDTKKFEVQLSEEPFEPVEPAIEVVEEQPGSLPWYLLYAFLGGLILNVMPCVLPVLAIKVMSFVQQAGESRGRILALNLVYAVGVISVFLVLATLATSPRILGETMGWGGLFQKAEFNLLMAAIVFAMGLSLLGVFEIPVPGLGSTGPGRQREGLWGAYFTGVLATLLATPCSGPFLGVTLAWSVAQEVAVTYLVWGVMGLGMASPYLLFGLFPAAVRWLPRPGNWMVRLKEFAGFVLMGTVIFFISFTKPDHVVPLLIILLGIALGLWMIGNLYDVNTRIRQKWAVRVTALALTGVICGFGYTLTRADAYRLPWEPFSEARLKELLSERRTVLIDFSAEWCWTCKFVEKTALNTEKTLELVRQHDVVPLYADYTHQPPEIKRWLEKFDSISVPLTVIFPAEQPTSPILLRDVYTQGKLIATLKQAVASTETAQQQAMKATTQRE